MSATPEDREVLRLMGDLERHGLISVRTDWFRPQDDADAIPYATVDLRELVRVLTLWKNAGDDCTQVLQDADREITRLLDGRSRERAMITAVRTGRRSPESLPESFEPLGTGTHLRVVQDPPWPRLEAVPDPPRSGGLLREFWEGVKDGLRKLDID